MLTQLVNFTHDYVGPHAGAESCFRLYTHIITKIRASAAYCTIKTKQHHNCTIVYARHTFILRCVLLLIHNHVYVHCKQSENKRINAVSALHCVNPLFIPLTPLICKNIFIRELLYIFLPARMRAHTPLINISFIHKGPLVHQSRAILSLTQQSCLHTAYLYSAVVEIFSISRAISRDDPKF